MSVRVQRSHGNDALVCIPRDEAGGKRLARVERAVRWLWSRGIYPGPSAMSLRLHGHVNRSINGVETKVRNRLMAELGITRQRKYTHRRWARIDSVDE